jgi:hypothetical protein
LNRRGAESAEKKKDILMNHLGLLYDCQANCSCGAKMQFIGQIPTDFGFTQIPNVPKQPDGFSSTEYCFLLGNQVYMMACSKQCHEMAAIAICDN